MIYTNWFSLCHAAINGVAMYSPTSGEWKQAHSQARFVILQVLTEAGENFVKTQEVIGEDGKPDLLLSMDRSKLEVIGKPAIGEFLKKLQVYKSTGDVETASKMFEKYSKVNEQWLQWRDIVISRKQPRKMKVQANTIIKGDFYNKFSLGKNRINIWNKDEFSISKINILFVSFVAKEIVNFIFSKYFVETESGSLQVLC